MPTSAKIRLSLLLAAPFVAGCVHFGDSKPLRAETRAVPDAPLASACARLQPFFASGAKTLTREALDAGLKVEFAKWDKDGSGDLNGGEIDPLNDQLRRQSNGASPVMDWDGDGRINFTEFASGWRTMFDLCDVGHDNVVTVSELYLSPNVAPPLDGPAKLPPGVGADPDIDPQHNGAREHGGR